MNPLDPIPVDPNGDVIINCSGTRFQVSIQAMTLAPVISDAIIGIVSTGVGHAPGQLPVISGYNDPIEPFLLFLNILHQNHESIPTNLHPDTIESLATLVDKYVCPIRRHANINAGVDSGRGRNTAWLGRYVADLSFDTLWRLLRIAWILSSREGVSTVAGLLVLNWPISSSFKGWAYASFYMGTVPRGVLGHLDELKLALVQKVSDALLSLIKLVSATPCPTAQPFIEGYLRALNDVGITPDTPQLREKSFLEVWDAASLLAVETYRSHTSAGMPCGCTMYAGLEQRAHLLSELARARDQGGLICIDCVNGDCGLH